MAVDSEHPLKPLVAAWLGKIERARAHKKPFQEVADECMNFYHSSHDFMWEGKFKGKLWDGKEANPSFRMTVNKVFEFVAIYGPVLYNRNPTRTVTPRPQFVLPPELMPQPMNPMDPMDPAFMQQQMVAAMQMRSKAEDSARAQLMQMYLNYTPNELELEANMLECVTEALIKGRGVTWTELYQPPGSERMLVGSFYDTVDNLLIDPDCERLEDALWIARECCHPYWEVEREYGLPDGSLKQYANFSSGAAQGEGEGNRLKRSKQDKGQHNDQIKYYKIWSKCGVGGRFTDLDDGVKDAMEAFGDHCFLAVGKGIPFPLNLAENVLRDSDDAGLQAAVEWPIPFWRDGRWPCSVLDFYTKPRYCWPVSPIAPGLGELKFINWAMSFLAGKIRITCRDFIALAKKASAEIRNSLLSGEDLSILEFEAIDQSIDKIVGFLQHPPVNSDIWSILSAVMDMFDKRTGLSEIMYGMTSTQMRSAEEAQVKQENANVRPDHMAKQVEKMATDQARLEGLAVRWFIEPQDVVDIVGPVGAQAWQTLINEQDVDKVVRELEYRIESGTTRKPNKDKLIANMRDAMQVLAPVLDQHAIVTGDTNPINALIGKWGESMDEDMTPMLMGPRMPPMPQPGMEEGGTDAPAAPEEQA